MSLTIRSAGVKDDCLILTATPKDAWCAYYGSPFRCCTHLKLNCPGYPLSEVMKYAWWEIFKAKGVYIPGLAGGRIPGIRHVVSAEGRKRCRGKHVRMDFALDLDMLNRHVDLHQAWEENGGNIMGQTVLLSTISNDCMAPYWGPRGAYVMSYQANAILKT
jgi:hypothetical protein